LIEWNVQARRGEFQKLQTPGSGGLPELRTASLNSAAANGGSLIDGFIRVARAKLGGLLENRPVTFQKWYNENLGPPGIRGAFSQPGIGGLDSGVLPSGPCSGYQAQGQISHIDALGLFLMTHVCVTKSEAAWYYSTATSLDRQNWIAPQLIENSQYPLVKGCAANGTEGAAFDGWYPSFMSPGHAAGHLGMTGQVFFMNGCIIGAKRQFLSRTFTITAN